MKRLFNAALALAALAGSADRSTAGILVFDDRAAWRAVIGAPLGFEDFNSFTMDVTIDETPVAGGPSFVAGDGGIIVRVVDGAALLDASPFQFNDSACSVDGTSRICGTNNVQMEIVWPDPVGAIGLDLSSLNDLRERTRIDLIDGLDVIASFVPPVRTIDQPLQFWGVWGSMGESFDGLRFTQINALADTFGFDNVEIAAPNGSAPISEPATLALLGLGIAALAGARRHP